jgi:CubicO group peptidase (beta-lactamase class C family)
VGNYILHEGSPESVGMDPARLERLKKRAASWVANGDTPSLCVLIARRGTIVLHEAFGVRRPEDTTPTLKRDSLTPIASCGKPLTAAAVMCLVEDGLIGLNRPFIEYIPELDVPGVQWLEEARVADLLCHTSGIDDVDTTSFIADAARRASDLPPPGPGQHPVLGRRIRLMAGAPLARRPGEAMIYSSIGYNLLGDIVRRVSGRPFWQFVHERIFAPLGMKDSYYVLPPELRDRRLLRAPGMPMTQPVPGVHGGINSPEYDEFDLGSGGTKTTALDLAIFLQMLLNRGAYGERRVLSPASVAAMTRHQVDLAIPWIMGMLSPTTGERVDIQFSGGGYGYGLYIFGSGGDRWRPNGALQSRSAFGHAGYASAYIWADPEYDLLGVYLGVAPRLAREMPVAPMDLFQNAVNGAIID